MSVSVLDAIEKRRTIRNYESNYQIPKEQLDAILHAAQVAPTACDFQGNDFVVLTNKDKLKALEKTILESFSPEWRKDFEKRREKHGVENVVTCDASTVILIVKNERSSEEWARIDAGIQSMSIILAAQNFGIESMCLGVVAMKETQKPCEKLLGFKEGSLIIGIALGKKKGNPELHKKEIKSKVSYIA